MGSGDDPLAGADVEGIMAWPDNYCQAHPIEKIVDAAEAFYVNHPHQ